MRRVAAIAAVLLVAAGVLVATGASSEDDGGSYKVRAIFDSAFSIIEQEDVKVAGVTVGKVDALTVTPDNRAAVVMDITEPGFQDFRQDAKCTIRPQSLIGEKYVECSLTEPRADGARPAPALRQIEDGPGEGQYLLPAERTSRPVDIDLLNNITRLPERQRLAIILNELGAGLAGRGRDLNATIRRANPALRETNEVLELLAGQNQVLRRLAEDSDRVLEPLARDRARVASFIENADEASRATAERREDLDAVLERLPRFVEELRPTMARLGELSEEFAPVARDLEAAAPDVNRLFRELGPFSEAGRPAFRTLGEAAAVGRPALLRSRPVVQDIGRLGRAARAPIQDLRRLTESLRDTGGIERLMDALFYQVSAINGYDQYGHYLRAGLLANTCTGYSTVAQPGCSSNFTSRIEREEGAAGGDTEADAAARTGSRRIASRLARAVRSRPGARAAAARPAKPALQMPEAVLPGQDPQRGPAQDPAPAPARAAAPAATPERQAQEGLLDYLLGGGS